jgi:ATP-dependent Clp protease protease subunit
MFQSTGGYVGDGICLYNFFKSLTIDLTIYNAGFVQSIAAVAFLGAKKRKTSARATFMLHRATNSPQFATATRLQAVADSVILDDRRIESILKEHLALTPEHWTNMNHHDFIFSGEEAIKLKMAHEIGEFSPPPGTQIFNI